MAKAETWPRVEAPEFTLKLNQKPSKRKSIFVADDGKITIEQAVAIAKDQAQKMGMGDKALLETKDALYSAKEKGWCVIVQSRF